MKFGESLCKGREFVRKKVIGDFSIFNKGTGRPD
jgi:hypothetical protein